MMFMISGRATNLHGSPIVRDGVVAAIHEAGHSVVTAAPRRGSYAYVDYLVATSDSIRRRVSKVRWATDRGIRVINYNQMWRLINDGIEPVPAIIPDVTEYAREAGATAAETAMINRAIQEGAAISRASVQREEAIERRNREDEEERERVQQLLRSQQMVEEVVQASAAGTYNSATEETRERPAPRKAPEPAPAKPPRRKIVTRR